MFTQRPCELFENEVFLDEVSDVLCIAQAGQLVFFLVLIKQYLC